MPRLHRLLPLILLAALAAPACRREASPAAGQRYPLKGKVVAVDVADRKVTIAHEDIPGFMPAMTMPFVVLEKDKALLEGTGPGDEITATLVAPDSRYWLEDLVVVRKGTPDPNATPAPRAHEAHPGDALPDAALVDLMMEEVDAGMTLTKELRAAGAAIPVFLLSSVGDALSLERATEELGVAAILQKPIRAETLVGILRSRLG